MGTSESKRRQRSLRRARSKERARITQMIRDMLDRFLVVDARDVLRRLEGNGE